MTPLLVAGGDGHPKVLEHDNLWPLVLGFQQSPGGVKLATSQVVLHVLPGVLVCDGQIHGGLPDPTVLLGLVVGNAGGAYGDVHAPDLKKVTKGSCGMPKLEGLLAKEAPPSTTVKEFDVFILPNRLGQRRPGGLAG